MATPPLPGVTFMRKDDTHALWPGPLMQVPEAALFDMEGSTNLNPISGFSGDFSYSFQSFKMFGSMILCTVTVADLTMAPGLCTADVSPPLLPLENFTRVDQASGAAAGVRLTDGVLVSGELSPHLGTKSLSLRLTNPTSAPVTPELGLQISFTYKYS